MSIAHEPESLFPGSSAKEGGAREGESLLDEHRLEEAARLVESLLKSGESAEAHFLLGKILLARRSVSRSLHHHLEAVRLGLNPEPGIHDRWMCWTLLGRFEEAWKESDRILQRRKGVRAPGESFMENHSLWDGSRLEGRSVVVRCYHGLGDTIQFLRYLPLLKACCSFVAVEVQPTLVPLYRGSKEIDLLMTWEDGIPRPRFDCEVECMELPYIFRSTVESLPAGVPYIELPPHEEKERRREENDPLRVGLVWTSGTWKPDRSIPSSLLEPLARIPGVRFFSLHEEPPPSAHPCPLPQWVAGNPYRDGIIGTGRAILEMDLIIAVDTMVAHLAGALGKPVWLLLLHEADWRWMIDREDSPWYPTMRLFRQPHPGDWRIPLDRIAQGARRMAKEKESHAKAQRR